jgi:glycosyltransferase involved in cell wall biosynthesis
LRTIYFTVTTDLNYDQRMIRICSSLSEAGYQVVLVGRSRPNSVSLSAQPYQQKRINCLFDKGKLFYAEYNLRLFFFLLTKKMDAICAIDLDSILPVYYISRIKKATRIYDAHELFCEMKEIVTRPVIYKVWKWIERHTVPKFKNGYTVNQPIADEFKKMYGVDYAVIRSISRLDQSLQLQPSKDYILYQGAVNEGRSFETLIPAMQWVNIPLIICGDGNFMKKARELSKKYGVEQKVIFKGMVQPQELKMYTAQAKIGITLFEKNSLSNYYSLANRFFDYIHSAVPQLCVNYPVYEEMNKEFKVSVLIDDLSPENIAGQLNALLSDPEKWQQLHENCKQASLTWCWQEEEKKLLNFYQKVFG